MIDDDSFRSASPVEDLLRHALKGTLLAQQGVSQARQENQPELLELCERALASYHELADAARQRLRASGPEAGARSAEQITSASFAPGDGATDADVLPDGQQKRAGNWPAY